MGIQYQMGGNRFTTGLACLGDDVKTLGDVFALSADRINAPNTYKMTPTHVAAQAGDVTELKAILTNPHTNPLKSVDGYPTDIYVQIFEKNNVNDYGAPLTAAYMRHLIKQKAKDSTFIP